MALKFRRRQKIFPGFYLNFSSKGISTTVGVKGLSVNFNKSGTYLNTGIPGTGLYDRQKIGGKSKPKPQDQPVGFENSPKLDKYLFLENLIKYLLKNNFK